MSGPYTADDDLLVKIIQDTLRMKVQFDLAEEIRKQTEAYNAGARIADNCHCPTCGKRGVNSCDCEG